MLEKSALLIPFGCSDYPKEYLDRFTRASIKAVEEAGVNVIATQPVLVYNDVEQVLKDARGKDVDFVIAVILSWLEAPNTITTLKEFRNKPILLWSHTVFKENEEWLTLGPIPGAGVIRETLEEMGFKFKFVWGMPDSEEVKEAIKSFASVASVIHKLSKSKIGLLGYASMGMYTATFDHVKIKNEIGPEIDHLDQYMLIRKMNEVDDKEIEELIRKARKNWEITERVTDKDLGVAMRMYLAFKKIIKEYGWDAVTIKCQYELSRYFNFTPCVPLSMLGNEIAVSCEGDIPLIITQLIMHYLTGKPVTYADIHTINTDDNTVLMGACGFAPFELALNRPKVDKHTALYTGLLNSSKYRTGKVTWARLASDRNGYKMHIGTGEAKIPPPLREVGCPQYPLMNIKLDGDAYHFGQHMMSQHYAVVFCDIKDQLVELCKLLEIKPIIS